jgi:shikimate kinase
LKRCVVLVGLMGSGKTSVGRSLAAHLGLRWSDLDQILTKRYGPIPRQFTRDGEAKFRSREAALLAQALRRGGVLSTGGGVVLKAGNRARLRRHATVYLQAAPVVLAKRLKGSGTASRPLLNGRPLLPRLRQLSAERGPFYRECAAFQVKAGMGSPAQVATRIARRLKGFSLS